MYTKNPQENDIEIPIEQGYIDEQKLFEEKLQLGEQDLMSKINLYNSGINIHPKETSNITKIKKNNISTKEEDDYDNSVYNLPISSDKNFLSDIILDGASLSKSLGFDEKLYFSEKKDFGTKSVKFNENNLFFLNGEEKNINTDTNFLIDNIKLFTRMNKERKKNYMIDLQYNNYPFNSIDNGSTTIGKNKIISRFSKEYKKNLSLNENSTIAVSHMRYNSQPFNGPYLRKNRAQKNLNYTINLNEENNTFEKNNLVQERYTQYNSTNINYKNKNLNRVLDLTNLYEENKLNGNSLVNFKYSNSLRKTVILNNDIIQKRPVLEEEYAFDSSGNQKFLCVKRFGDDNNKSNLISKDNLVIANKKISLNKKNIKQNNHLKEIAIKNINMNYPNKILKKSRSKNSNMKTMERFVFYSPQVSYKNIFSPNNKNYLGKLYKRVSDKMKNGNQQYTSLIKPKMSTSSNIKININNNLKNSKSCIFKYWQNQQNKLVHNKNSKNNFNISNSYNIKFLNSFNKVINSENNINKNDKGGIGINGGENNHTINNNSRNYNHNIINTESAQKNVYSFNSLNYNNMNNNNELFNSVKNRYELYNLNNNDKNKIYFPLENIENVKVDYSNKNNYKYHEIKSSKEKQKKINSVNIKNSKAITDKQKILASTSMDNILKKYNNLYKIISKDKLGKKIYIENINKSKRINRGLEVEVEKNN